MHTSTHLSPARPGPHPLCVAHSQRPLSKRGKPPSRGGAQLARSRERVPTAMVAHHAPVALRGGGGAYSPVHSHGLRTQVSYSKVSSIR